MNRKARATVLLSGTGRSLENLLAWQRAGRLEAELTSVISSRAGVRGLEVAARNGLAAELCPRRKFADAASFSRRLTELISKSHPDVIVMAGFLSLFLLPSEFTGRTINIHPSLLPLFGGKGCYGDRVHKKVIESGMRVSGCTVHFVDAEYDRGPIIGQWACPVLPTDDPQTLAARVFDLECEALPTALNWVATGQARLEGGQVAYAAELVSHWPGTTPE